jgi:hypothetical protein
MRTGAVDTRATGITKVMTGSIFRFIRLNGKKHVRLERGHGSTERHPWSSVDPADDRQEDDAYEFEDVQSHPLTILRPSVPPKRIALKLPGRWEWCIRETVPPN